MPYACALVTFEMLGVLKLTPRFWCVRSVVGGVRVVWGSKGGFGWWVRGVVMDSKGFGLWW